MGSAGSNGPTAAYRVILEYEEASLPPDVDSFVEALQGVPGVYYVEVHRAGDPCQEVGHLIQPCLRCHYNGKPSASEAETPLERNIKLQKESWASRKEGGVTDE